MVAPPEPGAAGAIPAADEAVNALLVAQLPDDVREVLHEEAAPSSTLGSMSPNADQLRGLAQAGVGTVEISVARLDWRVKTLERDLARLEEKHEGRMTEGRVFAIIGIVVALAYALTRLLG